MKLNSCIKTMEYEKGVFEIFEELLSVDEHCPELLPLIIELRHGSDRSQWAQFMGHLRQLEYEDDDSQDFYYLKKSYEMFRNALLLCSSRYRILTGRRDVSAREKQHQLYYGTARVLAEHAISAPDKLKDADSYFIMNATLLLGHYMAEMHLPNVKTLGPKNFDISVSDGTRREGQALIIYLTLLLETNCPQAHACMAAVLSLCFPILEAMSPRHVETFTERLEARAARDIKIESRKWIYLCGSVCSSAALLPDIRRHWNSLKRLSEFLYNKRKKNGRYRTGFQPV